MSNPSPESSQENVNSVNIHQLAAKVNSLEYLPTHVDKLDDAISALTMLAAKLETNAEEMKDAIRMLSRPKPNQLTAWFSIGLTAAALVSALIISTLSPMKDDIKKNESFREEEHTQDVTNAYADGKLQGRLETMENSVQELLLAIQRHSVRIGDIEVDTSRNRTSIKASGDYLKELGNTQKQLLIDSASRGGFGNGKGHSN